VRSPPLSSPGFGHSPNALVRDRFDYDTGSLETGISPWKFLGDESTLETKPM
jgi:hypothetical protein